MRCLEHWLCHHTDVDSQTSLGRDIREEEQIPTHFQGQFVWQTQNLLEVECLCFKDESVFQGVRTIVALSVYCFSGVQVIKINTDNGFTLCVVGYSTWFVCVFVCLSVTSLHAAQGVYTTRWIYRLALQ